jgi:hypothetical protein
MWTRKAVVIDEATKNPGPDRIIRDEDEKNVSMAEERRLLVRDRQD